MGKNSDDTQKCVSRLKQPKSEMATIRLYAIFVVAAASSSVTSFAPSSTSLQPHSRAWGGDGNTEKRRPLSVSSSSSSSNAMNDYDDFADFSSTQLAPISSYSSSSSSSDDTERGGDAMAGNGNGDVVDPFLASLISRVREVREKSDRLVSFLCQIVSFHRRRLWPFPPGGSSSCEFRKEMRVTSVN